MVAIIGLGNPGRKYERTRHNVGFMVIEELARERKIDITKEKYESLIGRGNIANEEVILAKPLTFMNESGRAVGLIKNKFNLKNENIIIISDSLDLPLGKIRIRFGGSSGGHNGLESIIQYIGMDFVKLRIGIGRPERKGEEIDYVLGNMNKDETSIVKNTIVKAMEAIDCLVTDGLEKAMNEFN